MPLQIPIVVPGQEPRMMVLSDARAGTQSEVRAMKRGPAGNEQTLAVMRDMVLRDHSDVAVEDFANGIISGISSHDPAAVTNALFMFCRSFTLRGSGARWGIIYRSDPYGFEQVQDARTTITRGVGDCGDKTVLLCTLLGAVGVKSRFVVLSYQLPAFQHVFLEAWYQNAWHVLDPTPEESMPGWQSSGVKRAVFRIYPDDDQSPETLADFNFSQFGQKLGKGAASGSRGGVGGIAVGAASAAVSFIPVVGPFLAPVIGLIAGLFHRGPTAQQRQLGRNFDEADKQVAAYLRELESKPEVTGEDVAEAAALITQLGQLANDLMASDASGYVKRQWEMETPNYAKALQFLADKVKPGSPGTIAASGGASSGGAGSVGGLLSGGLGSLSSINPLWLIGGGVAAWLLIKSFAGGK